MTTPYDGCEFGRLTREKMAKLATSDELHAMAIRLEAVIVENRTKASSLKWLSILLGVIVTLAAIAGFVAKAISTYPAMAATMQHERMHDRADAGATGAIH